VEIRWGRSVIFSVSWKSVRVRVSGSSEAKSRPAGVSSSVPRSSVSPKVSRISMVAVSSVVSVAGGSGATDVLGSGLAGIVALAVTSPPDPRSCPPQAATGRSIRTTAVTTRLRHTCAVMV
jgi:hypothetical protein